MKLAQKHVYEIDGAAFSSLEGFFDEVSRKLIPDAIWGKNLDAFNDILRGGFGTPQQSPVVPANSFQTLPALGFSDLRLAFRCYSSCYSFVRCALISEGLG
jgi:hypothetical protein